MDPRERFTATVDDYRRHRPDYPEALFDWMVADAELEAGDVVVDVGCGTGISSRQLAARGLQVVAVDPNPTMLAAAREQGGDGITWVEGDGETLPIDDVIDGRVAAIFGGQSFHWLDLDRALPRFRQVVRPGGRIIPFWNLRDASKPLMAGYELVLVRFSEEYARVGAEPRAERLMLHPQLDDRRTHAVAHHQRFDREGFFGRVWSSSYVKHGVHDRPAFDAALSELFDRWSEADADAAPTVTFDYLATAVSFR
ncbi:MAG: class I SAM-dependent methyltransferase [Polyangiaceae bacterium]